MALPKIQLPFFDVVIPSTAKKTKIRPMTVKEEKILLIAKQANTRSDQLNAIAQVVHNCLVDTALKTELMPLFDIEYLFLKIRQFSVSNIAKVSYKDNEDEKVYDFSIDLEKVEVDKSKQVPATFNLTDGKDGIVIVLKYPSLTDYKTYDSIEDPSQLIETMLTCCIEKVFEGSSAFKFADATPDEKKEFVQSIPSKCYADIQKFFDGEPRLYYKIEYKNSAGTAREIELTSLEDFFTFA
jgi:hypothetical protein